MAIRKEIYSSKLVLKDVVSGSQNVTESFLGQHRKIRRIELSSVAHTGKREKEPTLLKAGVAYARTYGDAILTYMRLH